MRKDYSVAQKVIHWLMALLIMLDLVVAQKFGRVMEDWDRFESRSDHATLGTIVTLLLITRLYYRFKNGPVALPVDMSTMQQWAAKAGHLLLYLLMIVLVLTGYLSANNADSEVRLFGQLLISSGTSTEASFLTIRGIHEFITNALIAMIAIHILAALYHHFVAKDDSTRRMLKFWRSAA